MEHIDGISVWPHKEESFTVTSPSFYELIAAEVERAKMHGEKFASLHEAWSVMFEELDEIWDITRMKRRDRDPAEIHKELIQLAAMAVKAMQSMDNFIGGKV